MLPLYYLRDWFEGATAKPQVSLALSRYLLPRVFEFLALGEGVANVGLEVSLQRFATGDTARWTERENKVIASFTALYLDRLRPSEETPVFGLRLDDVLCMFSAAGHPAQTLTDQIWAWSDDDLLGRLAHDWGVQPTQRTAIWSNAFWNGGQWALPIHAPNEKHISDWYRSPTLVKRATRAYENAQAGSQAQENAYAVLMAISA